MFSKILALVRLTLEVIVIIQLMFCNISGVSNGVNLMEYKQNIFVLSKIADNETWCRYFEAVKELFSRQPHEFYERDETMG